ncbi:MAG: DHHW family protein [Pseudoflavonifractor sp.]|nr:DHHW family protein [Alloprevotella sp.]MCM1117516.1 DHHW family protein [Pseudoflavonifractor sp.]
MRRSQIFLFLIGTLFLAFSLLFIFFPRPSFSEIERRELSLFPEISSEDLASGSYTRDISAWFSDTQPYRDHFLALAMKIRDKLALHTGGDDEVSFHAPTPEPMTEGESAEPADMLSSSPAPDSIADYDGHATPEGAAKMASSGVLIVGSGPDARALMAFGGRASGGVAYAEAANLYKSTLGSGVKVYCMVIPLASEFYTPEKARKMTQPQLPVIRNIYSHLADGVKGVDAYTALASHASEPIYLRTDHHWAPLGAYYAAEVLAKAAEVPFIPLAQYDSHTITGFVGSMFGFSKDIAIKNAPEDFVYYTPKGVEYSTTYTTIKLDSKFRPVGETKPYEGRFFHKYGNGSSSAYLTFMGGDYNQTVVRTSTANGRRLMIIKDSYGNALPGFLFGSFEEIHVLDHRYFRHDIKSYVAQNKITDLVMVNNIFNAYSSGVARRYKHILTQSTPVPAPEVKAVAADSASAPRLVEKPDTTHRIIKETPSPTSEATEPEQPDSLNRQ